jgi:Ca2+-binding EF-hand superfamily protein
MLGKLTEMFAGSALAITIITGAALATGPGIPRGEKMFGRLDVDSNGKLSIAEIQPKAEKRFFRIDSDADGTVSKAEIELWLKQTMDRRRDRMLARLDADKNSTVSAVEYETFLGSEFNKADKNSDGAVTFDEANAYKFTWREKAEKLLVPEADVQ